MNKTEIPFQSIMAFGQHKQEWKDEFKWWPRVLMFWNEFSRWLNSPKTFHILLSTFRTAEIGCSRSKISRISRIWKDKKIDVLEPRNIHQAIQKRSEQQTLTPPPRSSSNSKFWFVITFLEKKLKNLHDFLLFNDWENHEASLSSNVKVEL